MEEVKLLADMTKDELISIIRELRQTWVDYNRPRCSPIALAFPCADDPTWEFKQ